MPSSRIAPLGAGHSLPHWGVHAHGDESMEGGTWWDHVEGMNMAVQRVPFPSKETRGATQCDSQLASLHL